MREFRMSQFWTEPFNPVLPTVMSDDLTYYEFVKKIFDHYKGLQMETHKQFRWVNERFQKDEAELALLNQKVELLNQKWMTHHDNILALSKAYTDKNISILENYTNGQLIQLNNRITDNVRNILNKQTADFQNLSGRIKEWSDILNNNIKIVDSKLQPLKSELKIYTDLKFSECKGLIAQHREEVDTKIELIKGDVTAVETKLTEMQATVIKLNLSLEKELKQEIANALEELRNQVADINGNDILVTDPTDGKKNNLRNTLSNIYENPWWAKITAEEYDSMGLNASAYDSRKITAIDYDSHARFIFFDELYMKEWWEALKEYQAEFINGLQELNAKLKMRNPITGRITDMKEVIYDILDKLHNEWNYTANEYDHLKVQAGNFDGRGITAFEYDFFAKKYLNNIPAEAA